MTKKHLTLGSLFDGSGGFPLAAQMCDIKTLWASEIEPFPIRVTTKRFPEMKHCGDIRNINGADLEPVDIITFSSPCQNLSNAGDRTGLAGSESGLFFEAIRIIKEMREATNGEYPRYVVWENVSNTIGKARSEDFRTILKKICNLKGGSTILIPRPPEGRWLKAGEIMGDSFSVAWRQLSAQYWGVPQKRKRIFVVADFNHRDGAGKILFESDGLSRYSAENFRAWQKSTRSIETSADKASGLKLFENHSQDSRYNGPYDIAPTVTQKFGAGGNNQPLIVNEEPTYCTTWTTHTTVMKETAPALLCRDFKNPMVINERRGADWYVRKLMPVECARLQGFPDWWCDELDETNPSREELDFWREVFLTKARSMGKDSKPKTDPQLRRWLAHPNSDSAEYKMWGNGVALPCVWFILAGIEWFNSLES